MTKLSVNINKIATLRNSRGADTPNVVKVAKDCERFGAQGITVHPRPDERHIRYDDVRKLSKIVTTEFNIEGYPNKEFIKLVTSVHPTQVTLVPDPPEAITSNSGWDTKGQLTFLKEVVSIFKSEGIRVSIFLDANPEMVGYAAETLTDRIELYTEPYADGYSINREVAITPFISTAILANNMSLDINAGHDLNLKNLKYFHENIDGLKEVSIGHALISDALYYGLENTIQLYLRELK